MADLVSLLQSAVKKFLNSEVVKEEEFPRCSYCHAKTSRMNNLPSKQYICPKCFTAAGLEY